MNDKCVWIEGKVKEDDSVVFKIGCFKKTYSAYSKFWKYCPFCGKEIEVKA